MDGTTWPTNFFPLGWSFSSLEGPALLLVTIFAFGWLMVKLNEPNEKAKEAHKKYIDLVRQELSQTKDPIRALQLKEILDQDRFGAGQEAAEARTAREVAAAKSTAFWVRQGSDGKTIEGPTWTDRGGK